MSEGAAAWLAELAAELRGPRRSRRRLLVELEGHLEDALADGSTEAEAVERLGSAAGEARSWNADARRRRWQVRARILAAAVAVAAVAAPVGLVQRATSPKSPRPAPAASRVHRGPAGRAR